MMNKIKITIGAIPAVAVFYLAYSYIQTQRAIAENGRFQQMGDRVLDTRTGEAYIVNSRTGESRKINQPFQ
jgi:hypothetical protein